jgi:hypothetical protein
MNTEKHLGDIVLSKTSFTGLDAAFATFAKADFKALIDRRRSDRINRSLLELIQKEKEPCFLLSAVLEFIERVGKENLLDHYVFNSFEIWLNQHSELSFEENYRVRAKIAGKFIERVDYQALFPIGMGKVYEGSHFVTAHRSPDLDTTVASFWGWLDAFAARVSDGMHIWNVPGGPPASQIEIDWIFRDIFGEAVFTHLAKTRATLHISASDLMTRKGMLAKQLPDSIAAIDHERDQTAVVIVDERGFYLGDWRSMDVEGVQEVILLLSSCLRWFQNSLNLRLIGFFAKDLLHFSEMKSELKKLFDTKLSDCEPALAFTLHQKQKIENFLLRVLLLKQGSGSTFEDLGQYFDHFDAALFLEGAEQLFDHKGHLIEHRANIFRYLEGAIGRLNGGITEIRKRLEGLDIALKTKTDVFGHHPTVLSVRADLEEMRSKIGSYPYLTVGYPDQGKFYPVGIVQAADIRKSILGTVSLRDFCNREEMGIPPYLEVISVIDHHKAALATAAPPFALISDVQSGNALVANQAFMINDRYSLHGSTLAQLEGEVKRQWNNGSPTTTRILQRLLKQRWIAQNLGDHYIHPEREFIEYLHFLYAILDDTDLLTKVSAIDVDCVKELLNRMKSIASGQEREVISLDDLPRDKTFAKKAAERILKNEEIYSLYRKVYIYREHEVEKNMLLAAEGESSNLFADTKEQNGCCRVGQTKIFAVNLPIFEKVGHKIRSAWVKIAQQIAAEKPDIALHIHMISTIVSAEDVYKGTSVKYPHKDELWIWISNEELATELLKRFLTAFQSSPGLKNNSLEVEFLGDNAAELSQIFKESFVPLVQKSSKQALPIAILRYNAGSLNSRKAMVSPYLPS